MTNQPENAQLTWRDGSVPVATKFDDPYYSLNDGLAEARFVFLQGNGLPERFKQGFHIAELGFGTGLNLLVAWTAWLKAGHTTPLRFTSFEAFPMTTNDMRTALSSFSELKPLADQILTQLDLGWQIQTDTLDAHIITGDVRETLPLWDDKADAWFLDGFSPAKNPEMWEGQLMKNVAGHTVSGGTFATFTAAGHVREKLNQAGFDVRRVSGFGRKRHMSIGHLL